MKPSALDIQHLSFERDNQFLFENISVCLARGELLQVYGANGSGKTTFLRIVAGLIAVENEKIIWEGRCSVRHRAHYQQQLHYIGHQNGIRPQLTVRENLQLNAALFGEHVDSLHAIEKIGLQTQTDTLALQLSAGQRRRLALARLLICKKPLWILDEPMTALDKDGQSLLHELLEEHVSQNGIAIVATHYDLSFTHAVKTLRLDGAYA